ncbi:hypothetical protein CEE69_26375 [Rhodopirellula bahusiensis]|uniref:Uncharacterized protein n=1 Tax=Rhodopirellula bahusiensis TaxID=2014065 RepID=A0A2G1W0A2_9BACT|nr:hypothetical protein CEE69_26375 [Rhodopirellula bahusiensis]
MESNDVTNVIIGAAIEVYRWLVLFAFDESGRLLLINFHEAKLIDGLHRIVNRYGGAKPSG